MKKISSNEIKELAKEYSRAKYGEGYYPDVEKAYVEAYTKSQEKHLKDIAKLQKILKQHRIIIDSLYNEI